MGRKPGEKPGAGPGAQGGSARSGPAVSGHRGNHHHRRDRWHSSDCRIATEARRSRRRESPPGPPRPVKELEILNKGFLPTIGITMGDASGVGPEIIMKSLGHTVVYDWCRPLVIGDAGRLREAGRIVNSSVKVCSIENPSQAHFTPGIADCIDLRLIPENLPWGVLSPVCGDAAYQF